MRNQSSNPMIMKPTRFAILLTALALGPLSLLQASIETYSIDPVHTWVGFSASHFFTKVPGYFAKVKGTILVDRAQLDHSSVDAVIEAASITTNTGLRDDDLRSSNFFEVEKFPLISFKSDSWKHSGKNDYLVTGNLTIKGTTRHVALKVTSLGFGAGMKGVAIWGWDISTTLDRRDFGITADPDVIGNSIDVLIHIESDLVPVAAKRE